SSGFTPDSSWQDAMALQNEAHLPAICATYRDYLQESNGDPEVCRLFPRPTPMLEETPIPANQLVKVQEISWNHSPEEYFDFVTPDAYAILFTEFRKDAKLAYDCILTGENSFLLTYSFHEQMVGFPFFQIEAPEGTTIELMIQEAHDPRQDIVMNNHYHAWSRFICEVGMNEFMAFEYESLRWIQLHIHGGRGRAKIKQVGVMRRAYPWPKSLILQTRNKGLKTSLAAALNTLINCAQETLVDGMGRERQQYSGDVGHQLHAIYALTGQWDLAERFMFTFGQGFTKNGFFMDTWPGYDRMNRISQRELDLTPWGPLLDHGVAFIFDNYHHYLYSGRKEALEANFPNFLRFFLFLKALKGESALLPVEDLGIPTVWMDLYFNKQRYRQCAFNLYVSALCIHILPYLCEVMGEASTGTQIKAWGEDLLQATQNTFWDRDKQVFIMNKPWMKDLSEAEVGDRSLAMAVLFDLCPGKPTQCIQHLATYDKLKLSFPANAGWRYWALAKGHRTDVILRELQQKWANLPSVKLNNTIQEHWEVQPDSNSQWSHAGVVPLYISSMCLAGISPLSAGSEEVLIFPQPDALQSLRLNYHTPVGMLRYQHKGRKGKRSLLLDIPQRVTAYLKVNSRERLSFPESEKEQEFGYTTYVLAGGTTYDLILRLT
ncbi:MAG: alpha-L-rhamnosidase C-terminal domain-containing protein, partial [Bacteroidota bacterium]